MQNKVTNQVHPVRAWFSCKCNINFLIGVALLPFEELPEVYDGVWGFNAILASASVMCVFFACNPASLFLGAFNLACVICAQYALRATMTVEVSRYIIWPNHLPLLWWEISINTLLFYENINAFYPCFYHFSILYQYSLCLLP